MAGNDGLNQVVEDKTNFHAWKFRMTNFLMGKDYWECIKGDLENAPNLPKTNASAT